MKIVIVGAGVVGTHVAKKLGEENKDVVLIEKNQETSRIVTNNLDCMIVNNDGSRLDVLTKAGVQDADYFIALTGSDEVNMVSCSMVSSEFPKPKTIARVKNPYYGSLGKTRPSFMGIDYIINPEVEAADTIVRAIDEGVVNDVFTFQKDKLQLRAYLVAPGSSFAGKTLVNLRREIAFDFLIPALVRGGALIIPSGDLVVREKDLMYFLGIPENLDRILGSLKLQKQEINRIGIVGGNRVAEYIIQALQRDDSTRSRSFVSFLTSLVGASRRRITLVEKSKETAKYFSQNFPDITVLNRDVAEEGALEQEQFSDFDLVLTVTDHQSLNLITAMMAKHLGVKKAIALVLNDNYNRLSSKMDIDVMVNLTTELINTVLNIVRKAHIKTLHSFYEDDVDLVELQIQDRSRPAGKKIQDIDIPKGALIIFVNRNEENIIPSGSTTLLGGDHIGIIVKKDAVSKLEDVFGTRHEF